MTRWAAVLAGGSGTRFWPLSTASAPKQLLPLAGSTPLLAQALSRLPPLIPPERVFVITSLALVDTVRRILPDVPSSQILGEPKAASTAPALAWATALAASRDPKASILSLHADWFVGDDAGFRAAAQQALDIAERHDRLVTVGIVPDRPEIGYGYIEPGPVLEGEARDVSRFVEKPDDAGARRLIAAGALWNSGLFAWTADRFFAETQAHAPEIAPHMSRLLAGDVDGFFGAVTPVAIDVSHFERSERVAVVPGRFPWDDIGTWAALLRARPRDASGNVLVGDVFQRDASGCVVWAEDEAVVLDGVRDVVVVRANGVTLVMSSERAARLKDLLAVVPARLREPA